MPSRPASVPSAIGCLPTLAWLDAGDAHLTLFCDAGVVLALAVVAASRRARVCSRSGLLYLSLVGVGRVFLSFQWDMLLLEAGLLALLVAPLVAPAAARDDAREPSLLGIWLVRWLLFRLMFASGVVKLLHDDPSAADVARSHRAHLPLRDPVPAAVDGLVRAPSAALVATALVRADVRVELAVPFLIFGPRRARLVAGVVLSGFSC